MAEFEPSLLQGDVKLFRSSFWNKKNHEFRTEVRQGTMQVFVEVRNLDDGIASRYILCTMTGNEDEWEYCILSYNGNKVDALFEIFKGEMSLKECNFSTVLDHTKGVGRGESAPLRGPFWRYGLAALPFDLEGFNDQENHVAIRPAAFENITSREALFTVILSFCRATARV